MVVNRSTSASATGTVLALGIEVHRIIGCLLENIGGQYRLAAWHVISRQPPWNIVEQSAGLIQQMETRLGRRLWDDRAGTPLVRSRVPLRHPPLDHVVISASPRPRLRVWLAGLTPSHSLATAQQAMVACQAQIVGTSCLSAETNIQSLLSEFQSGRPNVLVIVGGYDIQDASAHRSMLRLCHILAAALRQLPKQRKPAILYAGNRWVAPQAASTFGSSDGFVFTAIDNVLPEPNRVRDSLLAQALNETYWLTCRAIKGFAELERWVTSPTQITTIESNFSRLMNAWVEIHNLTALHGLYCGADRWLHVSASEEDEAVRLHYTEPKTWPPTMATWPPLQLISGQWPEPPSLPTTVEWWDHSGITPLIGAVGQVLPSAMVQVLGHDLLTAHR